MDDYVVTGNKLFEIAQHHYNHGGQIIVFDEVHKYENWSQELKNVYDVMKKLKVIVSGSSILQIIKGNADLSRRAVVYKMNGLSLREFIFFETKTVLPKFTLLEIVQNHVAIASDLNKQINSLEYFNEYLKIGYYPYYLENKKTYINKLASTVNQIIDVDLPQLLKVEVGNLSKIKKLVSLIGKSVPFTPNITKLGGSLEMNRQTVNTYLHYLHEASILHILWEEGKGYSHLAKPDKLYLHNPNLFYVFNSANLDIGSMRETFFINQLAQNHEVEVARSGDFRIDKKYTFEIGGMGKNIKQIATIENSFIAADDILIGSKSKIPLWLFGYLY